MSVIQKIRTKYAKLAGFVIALALVGFILMDAFSNRGSSIFGKDDSVAKVNGEKIDYKEYSMLVQNYETLYGANQAIDDNMRAQLQDQALQDLVKERLIMEDAERLGLTVTEAEKKDMIYGSNPDQGVRTYQPFINPETKMFDPQYVKLFEEQVDQLDPSGKARAHWEAMRSYIQRNALMKKYDMMYNAGIYVPKFLAQQKIKEQAEMASINFVKVGYETVKDAEVKVTDEDLKAYMKEHADQFMIKEPTRTIEYVSFDVQPKTEDTARALGVLNELKAEFATTADAESFVNRNSDESFQGKYQMKNTFQSMYTDSIFNTPVGAVYGPYFDNGNYKMVKVLDKKTYPDSVKCRHILVQTAERGQPKRTDSVAKMTIDSAVAAVKGGMSFNEVVQKYSDDEGSKNTAGEYTFPFSQKDQLSKEFADFIFDGKTGETKIVKVENGSYAGYHYIEILNQSNPQTAVKIATVSKSLFAGENTDNETYAKATEFASQNNNDKAFDKSIKEGKAQKLVAENIKITDHMLQGIGPAREVVKWAYTSKVGDVSQVFPLNGRYIVAKLSDVQESGLMKLNENLRRGLEPVVMNKKKAEIIVKKYKGNKSLENIAASANTTVMPADSFRANSPFIPAVGYEPKVAGYSFSKELKPNTVSEPIKGQAGVFFISVKSRETIPTPQDESILVRERVMEESQTRNTMSSQLTEMLKKDATIKYNGDNL